METATVAPPAPAAPATSSAPAEGFLGGQTAAPPAQVQAGSTSLFSESIYKDGQFVEGWTTALQEKFPSLAGKLASAKDQEGALKILDWGIRTASGRELKGAPNGTWTEREVQDYREKFEVPANAEDYKFKPEKLADGVHWPEEANELVKWAHENHLPAKVVESLGEKFAQHLEGQTQHAVSKFEERISSLAAESEEHFQKEWGRDADGKREALKNYVASKFSPEELKDPIIRAALSHKGIVEMIANSHASMREGTIPGTNVAMPSGSHSAGQQAEALMKTKEFQLGDKATITRVKELFSLQAQNESMGRRK